MYTLFPTSRLKKKNKHVTITYCKEIHNCVSSLSKQWLTKSDTEEWAWIH